MSGELVDVYLNQKMIIFFFYSYKRDVQEKKREEERVKRQAILEQYRLRKAQEEAENEGNQQNFMPIKNSAKNSGTVVLNRPARMRPNSTGAGKPRPKSLHVSASTMGDYTSLDQRASRVTDDIDANYSVYSGSNHNAGIGSSRPQSAMSGHSITSRKLPSPTSSNHPSMPPNLVLGRHYRGPPSDGASDAGSTFSEYTGPKLFVKPTSKSNKCIILNAINVVLAGAVNNETKRKVLEVIC